MGVAVENALIQAKGLAFRFPKGTVALSDVDFSVAAGEFVSLVGPSGCGKSTLLRLVAGLLPAMSGSLTVGGADPKASRGGEHRCGFVFQSPTLLPWRTVEANLTLPLELEKVSRSHSREVAADWLSRVGLSEFAKSYPAQLSGGMRMRVSIARALASRPQILLMDEPFAALDDITRGRLQEELLALREREGFTTLFVTHNVSEAVFLSDRVLVLSARPGRVIGTVSVPFGTRRDPDLRGEPEFAHLVRGATHLLREAGS
jgi:NitT/TauT family transport system ATP-binding protein